MRLLLVDDDAGLRQLLRTTFEVFDIEVDEADSGMSALARIRARRPDVVVLDVHMPGMSGLELARAAQRVRPEIKVVFTSGYVDGRAVPAGAPFVPKPWRVDQVSEAIVVAANQTPSA